MSNQQPPSYQESVGTGGYTNYGAPQGSAPPAGQYDSSKGYPGPQGYQGGYQQIPSYQNQAQIVVQPQPQIIVVGGCPSCRVRQSLNTSLFVLNLMRVFFTINIY
ncbi:uncharacterized protein LOC132735394 [Ruditapes philippinarum]|uniref:uncharacterized protein LOC132735394 n=1 Tax=Ruditapes philippinarum TaxID=129788 RepID=UPI00295B5593|nr:uncharacterized protein LOC132735394 [Ruditapes philippinarum]